MNLAKVSELTKVSPRMLRYYENLGLIQPHRASNNYRIYTQKDIENIKKIKILNDAGMNLKDIHVLLPCFDLDEGYLRCVQWFKKNCKQNLSMCPIS